MPDERMTSGVRSTPPDDLTSDLTSKVETQSRLRYHDGQKEDKEYCVPKKT